MNRQIFIPCNVWFCVFGAACIVITGCNAEGIKEKETQVEQNNSYDSADKKLAVPQDSVAQNFDSVFAFSEKKPVDSLRLKSGVKLTWLVRGSGNAVKKYDVAAINYRGAIENGKEIESNELFKKPIPYVVGIGMTFDAFDEVLSTCRYGDKIRFIIPADKAYGKKGRGSTIPPNANLVYEIDVVQRIEGKKTASGCEYFILYKPDVEKTQPEFGDRVELSFMGWVKKTGRLFEASAANGKLAEFTLGDGGAIKAWQETVMEMHQGEKVLVLAPAEACYGSKGVPELVPANSDLVYILELKNVAKEK
ncbi:MAG TPA: FKBP-type peptidyl-prolyl cis-trans isomerase [Flavobacteriales bacterium]|nr:FKBP-type peptidyl-prolyl cis-trans isomerase [Flavobacteriales bacterium]